MGEFRWDFTLISGLMCPHTILTSHGNLDYIYGDIACALLQSYWNWSKIIEIIAGSLRCEVELCINRCKDVNATLKSIRHCYQTFKKRYDVKLHITEIEDCNIVGWILFLAIWNFTSNWTLGGENCFWKSLPSSVLDLWISTTVYLKF